MRAADRRILLLCAALAVASPGLAGSQAWHYLDDEQRHGLAYVLLYWPSIVLARLPPLLAAAFTVSALPTVLMYFAAYVGAWRLVRRLASRWRGPRE